MTSPGRSLALGLLLCAACGGSPSSPAGTSSTGVNGATQTELSACPGAGTPLFDALPISTGDFLAFRPLGFLSPPIHMFPAKHSAFSIVAPGASAIRVPVRAPGRVWVKEIWEASFSTGGQNYQLYVYPCTEVRVYFGHIATLSSKLMTAMQATPASCNSFADGTATVTTCRHELMSVMLASNEEMGTGPDTSGVDFGLLDFRLSPAPFVRLDHYDHFYPYWASPLDYFTASTRSALASKTGSVFGAPMRTVSPAGGTFMQDVPGTAQGNWFLPGVYHSNTTDLSPLLGLVSDYVDPGQPIMAIGTTVNGASMGLYSYPVEGQGLTNRAFRNVRADGNTYCFDRFLSGSSTGGLPLRQPNGVMIASMPTDTTLKVELVAASSCAATSRAFTPGATLFER